ncbi:hypothetical protein [Nocardia terrae]|uniref:hypothetical protein n=1 Tax=Nocardia terrae TaxID=2675851 RepID=UPI0018E011CF|nr:hypothetical protein [Nocardia terrae]
MVGVADDETHSAGDDVEAFVVPGGAADPGIERLATAYRRTHPEVDIRIRDTDPLDPILRRGGNARIPRSLTRACIVGHSK